MPPPAILFPVFALVAWTLIVLCLIPMVRVRSALRREIAADDFRFGESASVPGYVSIPNRNFMNLLELPVLFYVVCLLLYASGGGSRVAVATAWCYVALRVLHSAIHLSYNNVFHRLAAFSFSNAALIVLWVLAALHLSSQG